MSVCVDTARHPFGRMVMCHMTADTLEELLAMVDRIGVARKWLQGWPQHQHTHFDIAQSKRALAVAAGAHEVDGRIVAQKARALTDTILGGARMKAGAMR